jgi:mannose-6-phosphate isomerase-like protein (cupin superfamily)
MIVKKISNIEISHSPFCGQLMEVLTMIDYQAVGVAIAIDIQPTLAHFHNTFDEIYFMLDGNLTLALYDPQIQTTQYIELTPNELCVISKGIHHKISHSSAKNRLCVISSPSFHADDEHISDKL